MRIHRDVRQLRDVRDVMATPKPVECHNGHGAPIPGCYAMTCRKTEYRFGMAATGGRAVKRIGTVSLARGWYCPDCGGPEHLTDDDDVPCGCTRCGSLAPAEFREGK